MNLSSNILKQLLISLLMPTFIGGCLATYFSYRSRLKAQREMVNVPIDSSYYEWKNFIRWGILPGILLSAISFGVGIPVTWEWLAVFQLFSLLMLLLFGYRLIHPLFTLSGSTLVYFAVNYALQKGHLNSLSKFVPKQWGRYLTADLHPDLVSRNLLFLIAALIFVSIFTLDRFWDIPMNPRFMKSPRGKVVARYRMKPFWVMPMLLLVPGQMITQIASWWPVFELGDQKYTFFVLPILAGLRFTVQAQEPELAISRINQELKYLGMLSVLFAVAGYYYPQYAIYFMAFIFLGGITILWRHRSRERHWQFMYGPANKGLRIVGVRRGSPAERMGICAGDVLLAGNGQDLENIAAFYEMVIDNRSYVKLRIRQLDGEIVMVETPIYEEDAYDLGIVFLESVDFS